MNSSNIWHETQTKEKEDKVVVKLYNRDKSFKKSILIPTDMYPINEKYKVFTYKNTQICSDKVVMDIFNRIPYQIGCCYQNAKALALELQKQGYDAKTYVGWLFTSSSEFPIHHCWVVLDDIHVLDLSDDFTQMLGGQNGENFSNATYEEIQNLIVSFHQSARKVPNTVRCAPVGMPTNFLYYVGCECNADTGKQMYQRLINQFPNHECQRNCDASGLNRTQKLLKKNGLM